MARESFGYESRFVRLCKSELCQTLSLLLPEDVQTISQSSQFFSFLSYTMYVACHMPHNGPGIVSGPDFVT